jgi:hypothetical protein
MTQYEMTQYEMTQYEMTQYEMFCIDVTFEMRRVLSGIHLFNDPDKIIRQHFILNRNGGEESKIAERERERVIGSTWWKRRDSVGHQMIR